MFCGYFTGGPVHNLADAMKSDRERFKKFFHGMLDAGHLSRAVAVRGGLHFHGAHGGGH